MSCPSLADPWRAFSRSCFCEECELGKKIAIEKMFDARMLAEPDWAMVERILAQGPQPGARRKERGQAIEYLLLHRMSQRRIAERVGVTPKSVERYAARMRKRDGAQA